ncbi:unnamed protein product, partial [Mesorhabditis spiculigera]
VNAKKPRIIPDTSLLNMILRFFAFLFCTLISRSLQDDLLSTRCQSECLHELTQRYQVC